MRDERGMVRCEGCGWWFHWTGKCAVCNYKKDILDKIEQGGKKDGK